MQREEKETQLREIGGVRERYSMKFTAHATLPRSTNIHRGYLVQLNTSDKQLNLIHR